jgi:7-cyano-7-deazaguanine synthase
MADDGGELLLMSGGIDSTCIAAWKRPAGALFIDYGQRPAVGELTATREVTKALDLPLQVLEVDCSAIGSGLLSSREALSSAPSPEWWPFRNQLLITFGASWALQHRFSTVLIGCVSGDGDRHIDGSRAFLEEMDQLLRLQEGSVRLSAPAIHLSSTELISESGTKPSLLGWTHSCHSAAIACGSCPGCLKRLETLEGSTR